MRFGVGRDLITPDVKMNMGGYGNLYGQEFTGIHDDLYVKTLVLEDKKTRLALVTVDALMDDFAVTEALASYAQEVHDIPREHVFVSYTHTHCGPAQRGYDPWQATQYFEDFQLDRMQSSLRRACANMIEGTIAYGVTSGDWNISRRKPDATGKAGFGPNFEYPKDRDLGLLRLRDLAGKDRALLLNYSCHPVTMGDILWLSAEYPGRLCQLLEARYYGMMTLFFQGAGGCTRPLITADGLGFRKCSFSQVDGMARSMAAAVEQALQVNLPRPVELDLASCWFTIPLPTEKYSREHYEAIVADNSREIQYGRNQAQAILDTYEREPVLHLPAGLARLGDDLYVAFMGGETCYEPKQVVLEALTGKQVIFIGYGDASAYIPGDRMLGEGGYEADTSSLEFRLQGRFQPGMNDRFHSAFKTALLRLEQ